MVTKVHIVYIMVSLILMYRHESWIIKKAECQRTDVFELWYWRRHLRIPLDSKEIKLVNPEGNQPWLFIRRNDAEAPYCGHILGRANSLEKDPDAGRDWGQEEKGATRMRWLDCTTDSVGMSLRKPWEIVTGREAQHPAVPGVAESDTTYQLNSNNYTYISSHYDYLIHFNETR